MIDAAAAAELPELAELDRLVDAIEPRARVRVLDRVLHDGISYPIIGIVLGPDDPTLPVLAVVGGVHGLERIGTEVALAYLHTLAERLVWDELLYEALESFRIVMVPLVNPVGMKLGTRANGRGVDLMRNGPAIVGSRGSPLLGGQRISRHLPWYMGDGTMEAESRALCRFIEREVFPSRAAIAIDCHSGFGLVDRLWFPYAHSRRPFPGLAEVVGLYKLLERTFPNHPYTLEPQAQAYTIVGDLWDHLYERHRAREGAGMFLPLTLEMGSWNWVKKNPLQIANPLGGFNPMVPHRRIRTLRRHIPLFDFLFASVASHRRWTAKNEGVRRMLEDEGFLRWYGRS